MLTFSADSEAIRNKLEGCRCETIKARVFRRKPHEISIHDVDLTKFFVRCTQRTIQTLGARQRCHNTYQKTSRDVATLILRNIRYIEPYFCYRYYRVADGQLNVY